MRPSNISYVLAGVLCFASATAHADEQSWYSQPLTALSRAAQKSAAYLPTTEQVSSGLTYVWDALPNKLWFRDAAVTSGIVGLTSGSATFTCFLAGSAVAGPIGGMAGGLVCANVGRYLGQRIVSTTYDRLEVAIDPDAFNTGVAVGGALGAVLGLHYGGLYTNPQPTLENQLPRFADYGGYAKEARRLTSMNLRPYSAEVGAMRSRGFQVDHIVPIKCGWTLGLGVAEIASLKNLQFLPAPLNPSLGAKGC